MGGKRQKSLAVEPKWYRDLKMMLAHAVDRRLRIESGCLAGDISGIQKFETQGPIIGHNSQASFRDSRLASGHVRIHQQFRDRFLLIASAMKAFFHQCVANCDAKQRPGGCRC